MVRCPPRTGRLLIAGSPRSIACGRRRGRDRRPCAGDRAGAERRGAARGRDGYARSARGRRTVASDRAGDARRLRRDDPSRCRDDRLRSGPASQHAVRQHVAARRRVARRCGISGRPSPLTSAVRASALPAFASSRAPTGARSRARRSKPQGFAPAQLAVIAATFARAGVDVVKDDHGLADQAAAPFGDRVLAVQRAVDEANARYRRPLRLRPEPDGPLRAALDRAVVAREARRAHDPRRADGEWRGQRGRAVPG